jgi:hypothetical protein
MCVCLCAFDCKETKFLVVKILLCGRVLVHYKDLFFVELLPQPRVTCDLLSIEIAGIAVNNAACAAHCILKGYAGGYCDGKGVCRCR